MGQHAAGSGSSSGDPYDGSWTVPGTGEPILRPGYDDPMMRGYVTAHAGNYRSWFASIAGFAAPILALSFGAVLFALLFVCIAAVPLLLLPGRVASRRRAVAVARRSAVKEGQRPGGRPSQRMFSWREILLGALVVVLVVAFVFLCVWELRALGASEQSTSIGTTYLV